MRTSWWLIIIGWLIWGLSWLMPQPQHNWVILSACLPWSIGIVIILWWTPSSINPFVATGKRRRGRERINRMKCPICGGAMWELPIYDSGLVYYRCKKIDCSSEIRPTETFE
jgi:hypothetical protein